MAKVKRNPILEGLGGEMTGSPLSSISSIRRTRATSVPMAARVLSAAQASWLLGAVRLK